MAVLAGFAVIQCFARLLHDAGELTGGCIAANVQYFAVDWAVAWCAWQGYCLKQHEPAAEYMSSENVK